MTCDLSLLSKGSYLPPGYLEHKLNEHRESDAFRLAVLELAASIRLARPDLAAHIKIEGHGLRILSDLEAANYNRRQIKNKFRGIQRIAKRRSAIDRTGFSNEDRAIAETDDRVAASAAIEVAKIARANRRKDLF